MKVDTAVSNVNVNEVGIWIETNPVEGQLLNIPFELVESKLTRNGNIGGSAENVLRIGDAADCRVMSGTPVTAVNVKRKAANIFAKFFKQFNQSRRNIDTVAAMVASKFVNGKMFG